MRKSDKAAFADCRGQRSPNQDKVIRIPPCAALCSYYLARQCFFSSHWRETVCSFFARFGGRENRTHLAIAAFRKSAAAGSAQSRLRLGRLASQKRFLDEDRRGLGRALRGRCTPRAWPPCRGTSGRASSGPTGRTAFDCRRAHRG